MKSFIQEIREYETSIIAADGDDERQHSLEDDMLTHYVFNHSDASEHHQAQARDIIMRVSKMDFARWCA